MNEQFTYKDAGVDTARKDRFIDNVIRMMRQTYDPAVIDNPWGFAGLYALNPTKLFGKSYKNPVLVGCTDGVGTKLRIAMMMNKHDTVGIDLVAMSVNDLVVTGAIPLFFLDYISIGKVDEAILQALVSGIVQGCKLAGCALLGGETAEMPGFYPGGEYDMAGFAVGIVEKSKTVTGKGILPGDDVIGIASSGLHSNGYSLARKILFEENRCSIDQKPAGWDMTLGEELLKPTRIYAKPIRSLMRRYEVKKVIKGIANITGGGMIENVPRILPKNCSIEIREGTWQVPPIFRFMREVQPVPMEEMYRVFNMGVGMVLVVDPYFSNAIIKHLKRVGESATIIGTVIKGRREVLVSSVNKPVES